MYAARSSSSALNLVDMDSPLYRLFRSGRNSLVVLMRWWSTTPPRYIGGDVGISVPIHPHPRRELDRVGIRREGPSQASPALTVQIV